MGNTNSLAVIALKIALCSLSVLTLAGCATDPYGEIAGNDIDQVHFHDYMIRDLRKYFKLEPTSTKAVAYEFLKPGPAQHGLGYPHYFVWLRVHDGHQVYEEGFAEIDAVETQYFSVNKFFSKKTINQNPSLITGHYGQGLSEIILEKAGQKS